MIKSGILTYNVTFESVFYNAILHTRDVDKAVIVGSGSKSIVFLKTQI